MGKPTASRAKDICTKVKGDLSEARHKYGYQLIAERILQEPFATDIGHLPHIHEGKIRENAAADAYAEITGLELTKVAFVEIDSGRWGCSPDRLIMPDGVRGACEIKGPNEVTQMGYLIDGGPGDDYRPQMQMQIATCNLNWNEFFSHNPRMPMCRVRFLPDDAYIKKLETCLRTFADELDHWEAKVRDMGFFAPAAVLKSDADRMADMLISDIDRLRGLQQILDREGDAAFIAALGELPHEQKQRVREAIEGTKQLMRVEAL